ncbi:MAG: hypothetical protein JST86_08160 [Bacteroidetes bacterium]|nr:hypothetical protein [Bacteroidota bacterium]
MKKILFMAMMSFGFMFAAKAQDAAPADETQKEEKIQALYVAYVTKQLNLTPEEAEKFWPLHTQFVNEMKGVDPKLSQLEKEQKVLDIKKKFQPKFTQVLGANRCEHFFGLRDEFNRKLLERINKQRANQPQRLRLRRGFQ